MQDENKKLRIINQHPSYLQLKATVTSDLINFLFADVRTLKGYHEPVTGHRRGSKTETGPNTISTESEIAKVQPRLFLSPNYTVVQAQTGTTATLHCEVTEIGESTVCTRKFTIPLKFLFSRKKVTVAIVLIRINNINCFVGNVDQEDRLLFAHSRPSNLQQR